MNTSCIGAHKIAVPYVSVWDGGIEVETIAHVDYRTGEVTDIVPANIRGLDICERTYIVMNDEQVDVYEDEHGFEHWADCCVGNEAGSVDTTEPNHITRVACGSPESAGLRKDIYDQVLNVIDSALALSGYRIMDGGRGFLVIRNSESDIDLEITVKTLPG